MWDCEHCGCQAIAGTLEFCPACFTPKEQVSPAAEPDGGIAEAQSSELSPVADGTPSTGIPETGKARRSELRAAPKPSPPPARGGNPASSAGKEWGKT